MKEDFPQDLQYERPEVRSEREKMRMHILTRSPAQLLLKDVNSFNQHGSVNSVRLKSGTSPNKPDKIRPNKDQK